VEAGFHMNSETEEALIYQEQSRTGNGPKIYGLFPNGRVEEFVKSHTLTHEEASRPEFLTDLGKVYARFHAMDLPLSRDYMRLLFGKVNINKELFYTPEMKETGIDFDFLLSIDFDHEMQMMKKVVDSVDSRDVLLQFDNHFLNVLTLEKSEGRNSQRDLRVMLIDYEISMYGKRFLDFGGHFNARMYNVANRNGSKASGHEFPPERERQLFLREYLKEYIRINGGDYNETIDNEEHLMLESEVGSLFCSLSMSSAILQMGDNFKSEPFFFSFADILLRFYLKKKENMKKRFPHLSLN
jgi:choline/ethanolamine kinase